MKLCLESQNHKMSGVGEDLWRSSGSTALLKEGYLEPADQSHIDAALEVLKRPDNLSRQPLPVLCQPCQTWDHFNESMLNTRDEFFVVRVLWNCFQH